jgi:Rad3-related DNA helicase
MRMSLDEQVAEWLAPGGRLAGAWPRYEDREAQRTLAVAIAETMELGGVRLAEAPTGVGKSLAYLLPSLLLAAQKNRRVVVATCTRSLQDQLYERDLPMLMEATGLRVPAARLKGKQNYLCPRALDLVDSREAEEREVLEALRAWAAADAEGDLDRFATADPETFRRLRPRVATDPAACTSATCRRGRECFWARARRAAGEARILIVNHALLALSGDVEGLLPDIDVLLVDEAHRLEGVLLGQLERSVTRNRFEELLRLVGTGRRGRGGGGGLLARYRGFATPLLSGAQGESTFEQAERLATRVSECRTDVERLFEKLAVSDAGGPVGIYGRRERYASAADLIGGDLDALEVVLQDAGEIARLLKRLGVSVETSGGHGEDLSAEMDQLAARWTGLARDLADLADPSEGSGREWVYWRTSGTRGVSLHGAPVSVGAHARRLVFGRARAAVLTSATLSSAGDFDWIAGRLGLGETHGLPYDTCVTTSPFPLERQMQAWVYDGGDETESVAGVVAALAARTRANILVLLTAHERLRRVRERLRDRLGATRTLLSQEWDGPAGIVTERFRTTRGAVLLGVQSLWEGVDFPGDALEILVVAKLPFSVPDDPMVEARAERLREEGLDPFRHDAIPEAVLRFRQGVGRLIRRADDRGVLVVCDPRLRTASYRRPFVESLPVPLQFTREADALAGEAARFLDQSVAVEES